MEKEERQQAINEGSSRINVENLMTRLQQKLGPKWDEYRDTLVHFLMGKLSKKELDEKVPRLLGKEVHFHNYILLSILANSFRELPPGEDTALNGWRQKVTPQYTDTPIELLHREILTLPPRERKRIRNIQKDVTKKQMNPPSCVVATRQAMLPKIPHIQDKKNGVKPKERKQEPPLEIPDDLHPPRLSGPLMWTQDIIHGFDTTLASESYEVPDDQSVGSRMLGIALENGLLRGIGGGTTDIMLASLEVYLDSIVSSLAEFTRNTSDTQRPLNINDLDSFYNARSLEFQETLPPLCRMKADYLQDEESVEEPYRGSPRNLLDLVANRFPKKRTQQEADLLENSEKGKRFLQTLLD